MPMSGTTTNKLPSFVCRFWDTKASKWNTAGVTTVSKTKSKLNSISCQTSHFTDFAGFEVLTQDQDTTN